MNAVILDRNDENTADNDLKIVAKARFIIFIECVFGVNRIYLFRYPQIINVLSHVYCFVLIFVNIYSDIVNFKQGATEATLEYVFHTEHLFFFVYAMVARKKNLAKFFKNLSQFDLILKIDKDLKFTSSINVVYGWLVLCVFCNVMHLTVNSYLESSAVSDLLFVIIIMEHDLEQMFLISLFIMVYKRIKILKEHVHKMYGPKKEFLELNQTELLCNKANLNIEEVYKAYELLHDCATYLNYVMSIPFIVIMGTTGISTIMMMYIVVVYNFMEGKIYTQYMSRYLVSYFLLRLITFMACIAIPCYYASNTASEASDIRSTVCYVVDSKQLDKPEHRKVKVFFYMTKENRFLYAMCGIFELNRTLPFSFIFLCATYMIIVVQFSKFID